MKTIILLILFFTYGQPLYPGEIREIIMQSIAVDMTYSDRFAVVLKTRDRNLKGKWKHKWDVILIPEAI
jgi:hypothetical protein